MMTSGTVFRLYKSWVKCEYHEDTDTFTSDGYDVQSYPLHEKQNGVFRHFALSYKGSKQGFLCRAYCNKVSGNVNQVLPVRTAKLMRAIEEVTASGGLANDWVMHKVGSEGKYVLEEYTDKGSRVVLELGMFQKIYRTAKVYYETLLEKGVAPTPSTSEEEFDFCDNPELPSDASGWQNINFKIALQLSKECIEDLRTLGLPNWWQEPEAQVQTGTPPKRKLPERLTFGKV
jgi:hypothetical protein